LFALAVVSAALNGIAVVVLGKYYSVEGVTFGYLAVTAMVIPLVALVWYRRRIEWHTKPLTL
jgi:O-antigen/teichoic acid export membrane protein